MSEIQKRAANGIPTDINDLIESLYEKDVFVGLKEHNRIKPHGGGPWVNTEVDGKTVYVDKGILLAALQTKDSKAQANAILNIMVGAQEILDHGEVSFARDLWNKVAHTPKNVQGACDFLTNKQIGYLKTVLEQRPGYFKFLDLALAKRLLAE